VAEFLAKFLDFHMKKAGGQAGISDENLIKIIDEVLILFRIVNAKDIFEEFYQRGLCRRLLLKKSASYDSEKMMVLKLKTECGDQFTTKVEGMLKDLTSSDNFMKEYIAVRGGKMRTQNIDVDFHVLGSNCWPISQSVQCKVPKLLSGFQEDFEKYYKSRN
jgi:cullin-4